MKYFSWLQTWVGKLLAAISLSMLIWQGFNLGLATPVRLAVEWYEALLHFLLDWATPYLSQPLTMLNELVGWKLHLYPHWKHVFILMSLYVTANFWFWWNYGGYRRFAVYRGFFGWSLALIASVTSGAIPLRADAGANVGLIASPIAAILILEIFETFWHSTWNGTEAVDWGRIFSHFLRDVLPILALAVLALVIAQYESDEQVLRIFGNPTLGILLMFVVVMAVFWAMRKVKNNPKPQLGGAILSSVLGACVIVVTNSGLKLAGL